MTTIKELLKQHKADIEIPSAWQGYEVDDEDEYTYHTETQDGNEIHVLRTEGYDRQGNKGYDEIIIDLNQNLITFIGADGVMSQDDENGNAVQRRV